MMKKKIRCLILLLVFLVCVSPVKAEEKDKMYALLISGTTVTDQGVPEMLSVLQKNQAYTLASAYTYQYEAAGVFSGSSYSAYYNAISTAYAGCTSDDTAFYYHTAHGVITETDDTKSFLGLQLRGSTWITYEKVLEKLCEVNCKHMIIVIDSCYSGNIYTAYNNLSSSQQKKLTIFTSSSSSEQSIAKDGLGAYTYYFTTILSDAFDDADLNDDGIITVGELQSFLSYLFECYSTYGMTPACKSISNWDTAFYANAPEIELSPSSSSIYKSEKLKITATVKGVYDSITWSSSDKSIATVSKKGVVTAKKKGTVAITATIDGASAVCEITVKAPSISLNKTELTLTVGDTKK